jgi:hypothetical protein
MIRYIRNIGLAAILTCASITPAFASVLTFDDLGPGSQYLLSNYDSFQFGTNNSQDTAWFYSDNAGGNYQPQSGSTFLATDASLYSGAAYEATQSISRATDFVFDGAYFSGVSAIGYQLFLNGALVFSSNPSAGLTDTPAFVASGYSGAVDSVVILGQQGYYALDNFTYHDVVTAVPEPSSWALMILGFGIVGGAMRRRSTSAVHARPSLT